MTGKFILLFILSFSQISCNQFHTNVQYSDNLQTSNQIPSFSPPNINQSDDLLFRLEYIIHSVVLERIAYNSRESLNSEVKHFNREGGQNWIYFKKKTVIPDTELVSKITDKVPIKLIDSFKNNQGIIDLRDGYDVKAVVKPIKAKDNEDLKTLFERGIKEFPKMNAAVSLSRIGFNREVSKAMVYAEFYSVQSGLKKVFFIVPFEVYNRPDNKIEGIDVSSEKVEYFVVN